MIETLNRTGHRMVLKPVREVLARLLGEAGRQHARVTVLVTTDDDLRSLNREFRGLDETTDVLSFPAPEYSGSLGDIAVSIEYARAQAARRGVPVSAELAMLAVHGGLHLLGWEDEDEDDREAMLAEMNRIMALAGLPTDEAWASLPHPAASKEG